MRASKIRELKAEFQRVTGRAPTDFVVRQLKRGLSVIDAIKAVENANRTRYLHENDGAALRRAYFAEGGGYSALSIQQQSDILFVRAQAERGKITALEAGMQILEIETADPSTYQQQFGQEIPIPRKPNPAMPVPPSSLIETASS